MDDVIWKIIAGLAVVIITNTFTWFYKRKFSLKFRHNIKHGDLNEFLTIIKRKSPEINTIKVLANVTNVFLPAFQSSCLSVIEMQLLLRKTNINDFKKENEYENYLKTIVTDWKKLENKGIIKKLGIKYFDFLTTDWQVIIDDKYIILGLNVPQKDDWKRFEITDTILIVGDSVSGKSLIEKYTKRFDRFYLEYGVV